METKRQDYLSPSTKEIVLITEGLLCFSARMYDFTVAEETLEFNV